MVFICLVAFFGVVTGVNAVMIRAAVSTFGGVETESAYKAGFAFARDAAQAEAQDARHWHVDAAIIPTRYSHRIEITASDAGNQPLSGLTAIVRLAHPTDRRSDVAMPMTEAAPGRFVGTTAAPAGQWDMVIDLMRDGERVFRSKNRVIL